MVHKFDTNFQKNILMILLNILIVKRKSFVKYLIDLDLSIFGKKLETITDTAVTEIKTQGTIVLINKNQNNEIKYSISTCCNREFF